MKISSPTCLYRQQGFAAIFTVILILAISFMVGTSIGLSTWNEQAMARNAIKSAEAYYAAEAGLEDAVYRVVKNKRYDSVYSLTVSDNQTNLNIATAGNQKIIEAKATSLQRTKKLKVILNLNATTISFYYGAQVGALGLNMENNAKITGNVYSNGNIKGENKDSSQITGDAWTAGANFIEKIRVGVDVHGRSIKNSQIDRDAYYQTIINTTVGRNSYPASPDPDAKDLPITYAQIQSWETAAEAGGIINPPDDTYEPADNSSLGPIKINGNLKIDSDKTITIAGPVWVKGNILFKNGPTIKLNGDLTSGFAIIADKPEDQINYGKITMDNNVITQDSPAGGYLLFIATNKSTSEAIKLKNNVNKDNPQSIIFSLQGMIKIENNAKFKEITGYGLTLENNAEIVYDQGLANASFSSGPGASWTVSEWKETP